uniref:Protein OS-9 homolog n=1 Tax=Mycena chlorophos TaxID=658473 RepID=A0ABQ0L7X0_MYCCL|nr:predicted protein [Mycena chlorophos]
MLLLLSLIVLVEARLHSLPDDTHAFPKYKVDFLANLPVPNHTVNRWLANGLRGGIPEFLEDIPPPPPSLGDPDAQIPLSDDVSIPSHDEYSLEHLKMGATEYICLIPKPLDPPVVDETIEDVTPAHSWSLLNPLKCLYHRQPWFTYSYCHNQEIRQFREIIKVPSLTSGPHQPEEDPNWESYTLGRAPPAGTDLSVADQNAAAANLELAQSANSRYLVQRWGDGTPCDKTGKPREVEVQFHCSMTTTDTIAFVREARTCSYVLVVHTPRLCGEPGFMAERDLTEQALISCREVIAGNPPSKSPNNVPPASDYPVWNPHRKPVLPQPKEGSHTEKYSEVIRKTLDAIRGMQTGDLELEMMEDGEGGFIVQIVDDIPMDVDQVLELDLDDENALEHVAQALKAMQRKAAKDEEDDDDIERDPLSL